MSDRKISDVDLSGCSRVKWPKPGIAAWTTGQLVLVSVGGIADPGHHFVDFLYFLLFLFIYFFLHFVFFPHRPAMWNADLSGP